MSDDLPDPETSEQIVPPQAEVQPSASVDEDLWDGPQMEETWSDAGVEDGGGDTAVEDYGLDDPFAGGVPQPPVDAGGQPVSGQPMDPIAAQYRFLRGALLESHKSAGLRADGTARKVWKEKDNGAAFVGPTPKEQADQARGKVPEPNQKKAGRFAGKSAGKSGGKWKGGDGKKGKWKGKKKDENPNQSLIDLLSRYRHELE